MQRTKRFGYDENEKCVFGIFFENHIKVLSLFVAYASEEERKLAESKISFCGLFWDTGMPIDELIHSFESEIIPAEKSLKKWFEKN